MVNIYDPDKRLRNMQNAVAYVIWFILAVSLCFYISFALFYILINNYKVFFNYLKQDIIVQLKQMYDITIYYFSWWWKNKQKLGLTKANYFTVKLLGPFLFSYSTAIILIIKNWEGVKSLHPVKKTSSLYGDAHWASESEIKKSGLRSKKGMMLGTNKKGYLVADGYQHALLFAPTGAGKGVGFVIPNLLYWRESALCHDIKLENYELTSGWRKAYLKQKVYVWEPANPDGITHCYNPVDWVSEKPGRKVDDVQKFANLVLQKKEFWENEARTLLVGVILYLLSDPEKANSFGEVVRTLRGDDFAYAMAVALDTKGDDIHPVGYMNLAAFLQKADKERSGVVSTLNSGLELWANPLIDAATAKSDFNFKEFRKVLNTVYVGLTPDNIQRLKSLMSMLYQQATDFLSDKLPQKDEKYGVLFLMDEFPTLGKMEQFMAGIAYFRGYRVRLFLIVQDTQQLKGSYEEAGMNSFLSNSTYRITFAANNMDTARLISDLVGNQTVESESFGRGKFFDLNPSSKSANISGSQRALLLPQEVISLPRDEQIILIEASPPIKTKKIYYYKDKTFTKKLWKKIPIPTQKPTEIKRPKKIQPEENTSPENEQEEMPLIAEN